MIKDNKGLSRCCNAPKSFLTGIQESIRYICSVCGADFVENAAANGRSTEELIKHIIEEQKQYAHSPLIGFDLEGALNQVAEAAKRSERKRIEEALPKEYIKYNPLNGKDKTREAYGNGFNNCLDQVRSIINPQPK